MKVKYNFKIKTLNTNNNLKILFSKKNLTKLTIIKKYLITRSPFKYNKTKEQFCLKYNQIKFSFQDDYIYTPKLVEYIFKNFFFFSNKYLISLKKKEIYTKI
jgi:hypothetical protein